MLRQLYRCDHIKNCLQLFVIERLNIDENQERNLRGYGGCSPSNLEKLLFRRATKQYNVFLFGHLLDRRLVTENIHG